MTSRDVATLSEEQLAHFDAEFRDWFEYRETLQGLLETCVRPTVLDVGGGNGRFLDNLLAAFPDCQGVLVDNSEYMLARNVEHPRKKVILGSALSLHETAAPESCDLITFNLMLHHLVAASSDSTTASVVSALKAASRLLRPQGHIVVYEQVYNGLLAAIEPGAIIFALTRLRMPLFTPMLRRMGANTAGVGVYFRSTTSWTAVFKAAGLRLLNRRAVHRDSPSFIRKAAFLMRDVGTHLFVLGKEALTESR